MKFSRKYTALFFAAVLIIWGIGMGSRPVSAESGAVFTCVINRLYQHPVTGEIEDSGGAESYSIGQGMVEGCVYPTGILELTDSGYYYLTIRMSLMDYTSGHTFWVQSWGEDGWSVPAQGITGSGTDGNGTTADICIEVPNENCIIRGTMYVEPMGRDVIWYMYPDQFQEGNSTDMAATIVTESAADEQEEALPDEEEEPQQAVYQPETIVQPEAEQENSVAEAAIQQAAQGQTAAQATSQPAETAAQSPQQEALETAEKEENTGETAQAGESRALTVPSAAELNSTKKEPAAAASDTELPDESAVISKAQGLTLSTAGEAAAAEAAQQNAAEAAGEASNPGTQIMINTLSVVIPGLILIAVGAAVVFFFRKNWYRWGHAEDDD